MMYTRCDQCKTAEEAETSRFNVAPPEWLAVEQDAEDPLHFCSWSCLAVFAAQQAINAEVGP